MFFVLPFYKLPIKHKDRAMKTTWIACACLLLFTNTGHAAGERVPVGARALGMGGTSVTQCDLWSLANNQAGTAWLKGGSAGLAFENHFMLRDLMREQLGIAFSTRAGTFGLSGSRFGNDLYNEIKTGISYARKFGKHLGVGIQLNYQRIHLGDDYGNKNLVSCEIGVLYQAGNDLGVGIHLVNPVPVTILENPPEVLPSALCAGLSYRFSDEFRATLEVEKGLVRKMFFRAGAEYHFAKPAYARVGMSTDPLACSFGFGLISGRLAIDVASGYHLVLGFSPSASVSYSF